MYVPHFEKLMLEPRGRAGLALQTVLPERGRQIPYDSISLWDIKGGTNELIDKAEIELQTQKTNLWLLGD